MPGANTSLVPYTATAFTTSTGSAYKAAIDAATAIVANPAGSFYVTPNSPAGMSVLIDPAFNYWQVGVGFISNEAGSQVALAIPAPGSGTSTVTVYWDLVTNTAGSVTSAGVAIMPEQIHQMPLAVVTVISTATSITAANIQDCRGLAFGNSALVKNLGTVTTNQVVNCSGARVVSVFMAINTAIALGLTLTNLQIGVPVYIRFDNLQATSENFKIAASTPGGVTYNVVGKNTANVAFLFASTGMTASGNNNFFINGCSSSGALNLTVS